MTLRFYFVNVLGYTEEEYEKFAREYFTPAADSDDESDTPVIVDDPK